MNSESSINIMHIASGDLWAGAEAQIYTLTKTLHGMPGISISVVLLNHGALEEKLDSQGIRVVVIDETKLSTFRIINRLIQVIGELKPDVIHSHRTKENIIGSIAAFLCGSIPSLRTTHGAPEYIPAWWQIRKYIIFLLDRFCGRHLQQRIVGVSEDLADRLRSGFPVSSIRVIENGIETGAPEEDHVGHGRSVAGRSGTLRIGFAGRLVPVKRVDLFISTARFMIDNHPETKVSFHIYGDGPLLRQLEELDRQLSTGDILHFEGYREEIYPVLQELDILLITSDHEGLPMIILEAMATKTAVIAHATGGIPDVLDHGKCGLLVTRHSPDGYAAAILELADAPEQYAQVTGNALQRVRTRYSATRNAEAYLAEYIALRSGRH